MRRYRKDQLLTASEIARYVYCQRAWGYDVDHLGNPQRKTMLMGLGFVGVALIIIALVITVGGV